MFPSCCGDPTRLWKPYEVICFSNQTAAPGLNFWSASLLPPSKSAAVPRCAASRGQGQPADMDPSCCTSHGPWCPCPGWISTLQWKVFSSACSTVPRPKAFLCTHRNLQCSLRSWCCFSATHLWLHMSCNGKNGENGIKNRGKKLDLGNHKLRRLRVYAGQPKPPILLF